ncbi:MAG: aminotransferase class III-fold pyridoxal phosphate-dependent enzyme [Candidatus Koribacter versatilis]|uniref:Aminotransferase class III-fold pyridoxal phosphate-dependent enzyme n=1 Tax=Candidatus Korobacter versatilis TaxID=658062 RepID=A0A932A821_9BACT|nr:aminotransferase class III-fold pyridoxal phosphate-dependent enzyme [Candidatus Koribacter versatilis]
MSPSTPTAAPRTANFPRSFSKAYPVASRGEGVYLWDAPGNRYLDFSGSAAVNFVGHGDASIGRAMAEQAAHLEFAHTSQFTTALAEEFARELLEFAGEGFRGGCVFFTCGGSEAVESALKLGRQYQVEVGEAGRSAIVSRRQAYHGATLGALAVSGNKRRREMYLPMVRTFEQVAIPYRYRCAYDCADGCAACGERYADELAALLGRSGKDTAAFIFEPVSGATLGAAVPPAGYLKAVSDACARHGVLTIADEVMTGMGRTGRKFAVEHWDVHPDILVTAKGIASGYAPLGAVLATKKVVDALARGSGALVHGLTYNAHPVALAAGRAVLARIRKEGLVHAADSAPAGGARTAGANVKRELQRLAEHASVGDVRGMGLLWAVEFVAEKKTKQPFPAEQQFAARVAAAAFKRGVLVYPMQGCADGIAGDHLLLAPPAIISGEQIAWAVGQLSDAIKDVEASGA